MTDLVLGRGQRAKIICDWDGPPVCTHLDRSLFDALRLDPQWDKLRERLFTQIVTNLSRDHLYERLFLNEFVTQQRFREAEYRGHDYWEVQGKWRQTREWYRKAADAQSPSLLALSDHFLHFEYADATSWEWIRWQEKSVAQVWHTKHGVYQRKERADVRDDPMQVQQ